MKNVILLLAMILASEAFAGCEDIPRLKRELSDKSVFLEGYSKAQKDMEIYLIQDFMKNFKSEAEDILALTPSFADKTTFEVNLQRIELIKEIQKLKKVCE